MDHKKPSSKKFNYTRRKQDRKFYDKECPYHVDGYCFLTDDYCKCKGCVKECTLD